MLRVLGNHRRLCDGLTRRDWLHIGGLGYLGLGLSDFSRLNELQATESAGQHSTTFGRAKSCILLLPYGSPPQHETFDPKPEAPSEIQGELTAIATSLPGIQIGEYLPKISQIMDRLTIVRSMTHPFPVHCTAYVVSGIPDYTPALEKRPKDLKHWPFIGSVVDYVEERRGDGAVPGIPRNMALPWRMNSRGGSEASQVQAGPYAAFLGTGYDPVLTEFQGKGNRKVIKISPNNGPQHEVHDPYAGVKPDCSFRLDIPTLKGTLTLDRLNRRLSLLDQFDRSRRKTDASKQLASYDRHQQMAISLLTATQIREALDIQQVPMPLRERYGMTLFGQSCLAARRLVEAGSKFVTVFWDEYAYLNTDWDTHWNHYYRLKNRLLPGFDLAYSGLILDLEQRGLLDETLVVWMSEHGRTPKLNKNKGGGRDHWSRVYSIALAGGGVGRGKVVGKSDGIGGDVEATPISPKDILATIFHLLGIPAHTTVPNRVGQPMPVAGTGNVRPDLF